jgi:hypothetical protein
VAYIEFQNGTTESEAKAIIEDCTLPVNYTIYYNTKKFITDQTQKSLSFVMSSLAMDLAITF